MKPELGSQQPQARVGGLTVSPYDAEVMVFDADTNRAHHLNAEARAIWEACDGVRSIDAISKSCAISHDVLWRTLAELEQNDLLVTAVELPGNTRRGMLRTAAMATAGAAVGIPIIRSIAVPTVAHAAYGCTAVGASCVYGCPAGCTCVGGLCA